MPSEITEPVCTSVSVQYSGGGKVAIKEYGKISSNWGHSLSRTFDLPADWTSEQIAEFQISEREKLREIIDPLDDFEFEERYKLRDWDD